MNTNFFRQLIEIFDNRFKLLNYLSFPVLIIYLSIYFQLDQINSIQKNLPKILWIDNAWIVVNNITQLFLFLGLGGFLFTILIWSMKYFILFLLNKIFNQDGDYIEGSDDFYWKQSMNRFGVIAIEASMWYCYLFGFYLLFQSAIDIKTGFDSTLEIIQGTVTGLIFVRYIVRWLFEGKYPEFIQYKEKVANENV
ncbi:hypothetical protein [Alkalihalobacillus sp. TS-13]|uniref:hypothetical protein n=1 Tax=Alkalihalobacillus sp. TS-13 TaxID=2842455 RepID=UPI001C86C7A3|nr:hypothetical protein [Alkalihalobacillus sp. TS-13]